jgi:hypothetical protein
MQTLSNLSLAILELSEWLFSMKHLKKPSWINMLAPIQLALPCRMQLVATLAHKHGNGAQLEILLPYLQ